MKNLLFVVCCSVLTLGCSPEESETEEAETQLGIGVKADQACNTDTTESEMTDMEHDTTIEADEDTGDEFFDSNGEAFDETSDDASSENADATGESDSTELLNEEEDDLAEEIAEETAPEASALCASADDPFAEAYNVDQHKVSFPEGTPAPTYKAASTDTSFYLGGTEFWQKWPGGKNPTYSYYEGTIFGQRCMYASARRFEAIMAVAPDALETLRTDSKWGGSFFNWNDDFSESSWGDGTSARLWAWRTTLVKWISQTNKDGSCYLPTLAMIESLASKCAARAATSEGEIQGCTN